MSAGTPHPARSRRRWNRRKSPVAVEGSPTNRAFGKGEIARADRRDEICSHIDRLCLHSERAQVLQEKLGGTSNLSSQRRARDHREIAALRMSMLHTIQDLRLSTESIDDIICSVRALVSRVDEAEAELQRHALFLGIPAAKMAELKEAGPVGSSLAKKLGERSGAKSRQGEARRRVAKIALRTIRDAEH